MKRIRIRSGKVLFWSVGLALLLGDPWLEVAAQEESPGGLAQQLVQANRILAMEGLIGPYGHVSVRPEGEGPFLIADHRSPWEVEADHIVAVKLEVTPAEAKQEGLYREVFIHAAVYEVLPEVRAVIHTHSPHAVALGTLPFQDDRVFPTTNPGANLGNFIPIYRPVGLIDDPRKGKDLALSLDGQNGLLQRGHGTVVVGKTLQQAVLRAIYLEQEARTQIWSRSAGSPVVYNPTESNLFKRTVAVEHPWHYYLDKLRRYQDEAGK